MSLLYNLSRNLLVILLLITFYQCTTSPDTHYEEEVEEITVYNGKYCSEITYYNPKTGTKSTYDLEVEVSDNELIRILWPNGGWLDQDHFDPVELDEEGYCSFTSDKDYEYTIQIVDRNCSSRSGINLINQIEEDEKFLTCSRCSSEKSQFDDYCDDCIKKRCPQCYRFDNLKYNKYDLCSNCERLE